MNVTSKVIAANGVTKGLQQGLDLKSYNEVIMRS